MSDHHSDDDLIAELKKRFDYTKQALYDLQIVTRKLEEVNQKLEESERLKSNFLSNIKNEINNPLTSIQGLAQQLAAGGVVDPEVVRQVAGMIRDESFDLDFQLRNIFMAAELESGELEMNPVRVEVGSLVGRTVETFGQLAMTRKVRVAVSSREGPLWFLTDPEKLHFVLGNLLSNAIMFNRSGGQVNVQAGVVEGVLTVEVRDTGIGIDGEQIGRLFERFRQLQTGLTKQFRGHGLGLSVIKSLMDQVGGTISVASEIGRGSVFTVSIPELQTDLESDTFSVDGNEFFFDGNEVEAF